MTCVDVIVPCYRYGHYLKQCVDSVLNQRGVEVRVLVIDDCSPDNTAEIARSLSLADPRVTFRRHTVNQGHIATYNEGIDWISSPYYLLLSADDYLLPGALRRSSDFLKAHPSAGLAFGQQIAICQEEIPEFTNADDVDSDWKLLDGLAFIKASGAKNCVPTPAAVVRTDLQKRIGGYRSDLPHSGDMEMWIRLGLLANVGVSNASHAVYRRHTNNMSLSYTRQHWLPDVQQRKIAIDQLLNSNAIPRKIAKTLHRAAIRQLATETVSFASSAFNGNEIEVSQQLREFAGNISPRVRFSQPWWRLQFKRVIGCATWQQLMAYHAKRKNVTTHKSVVK